MYDPVLNESSDASMIWPITTPSLVVGMRMIFYCLILNCLNGDDGDIVGDPSALVS